MRIFKIIFQLNIKTIVFNFTYFKWEQAIRFPVLVSRNVIVKKKSGTVILPDKVEFGLIKIGFGNIGIFDRSRSKSIWEVSGIVDFRGKCSIGHGSKISVGSTGKIIFGENFTVTAESVFISFKEIEFGANCLISWDVHFMDTDFHQIYDQNNTRINPDARIEIGDNVWIGNKCSILKGAAIPDNSIIGSGTLVSSKLNATNSIYVGNPVRIVRQGIRWEM